MTSSRTSPAVARAAAFIGAAASFVALVPGVSDAANRIEVAADANAPVRLAPPPKPLTPPPGTPAAAPAATPPANPPSAIAVPANPAPQGAKPQQPATPAAEAPGKKIGPTIEVAPLQEVDPESVGVIDQSKGGFGLDMWAGTPRSLVQRLLPQLPVKASSPVMHDLMRRLLLSIAKGPEGERTEPNLISLRVERLAALGDADGMGKLLDAAPNLRADEDLSRTRVNGLLLSGDTQGACAQTSKLIQQYATPYWQKAFAFCHAVAGEKDQARLSVSLLRDTEADKDPSFFAIMAVLLGDSKKDVKNVTGATPLTLAMLKAAKQQIPASIADNADLPVLQAIATSTDTDPLVQLPAAERAEAAGLIQASDLAKIYSSISFKPDEISNALTVAEKDGGPRGRALLYQAASQQTVPTARAEVLQAAWKMARAKGVFGTTARVTAPLVVSITPAAELMWFAADAGRTLFAAGDNDHALDWYNLAAAGSTSDADARKAEATLWPLAKLADSNNKLPQEKGQVIRWINAEKDTGGDGWQDHAGYILGLLDAVGTKVDASDWEPLIRAGNSQSNTPGVALLTVLREAADDNHTGQAVLLAMLALGDSGPAGAGPIAATAAVGALNAVGLTAEARKLAIEAAAAGP